ncbi:MAG: amidohydrolase [Chloroflexi bacterium]|nr:MAG: amidohydrolase [Chloroflexota bacterium]TME04155.1 MAG: amidohydrolase [Chloroflexota bacterium]TME43199.1 MAG: amidohydrolase [Chloroflexota bacterium]TME51593.1 MAG: amidohydrolase [Chloroflexota bacterium]
MRKIDAFAHILPRKYRDRLERQLEGAISSRQLRYYREGVFDFDPSLTDLDARWRSLEAFADYAQVLVLAVPPLEETGPPAVAAELARLANDEMAELVQRHPDRFVGFAAALPLNDTEAALEEIDHAVNELHALGAQVYTNMLGTALDDPRFEPIFARMESMGRTVWLHPTRNATWRDYPTETESDYGLWWSIGWPYETAAALSRLVYSGTMERHPNLKLIAHHGAGMVPHFSARLAMGPGFRQVKDLLPRPPLDYFRRFYADTALFGAPHAVRCVLDFFGSDHVVFGTDMPLGPAGTIKATIADIDAAGLPDKDRSTVYADTAERLFL